MRTIVVAALVTIAAAESRAQACTPTTPPNVPAGQPFFEFQVETPASFIPDSTLALRPVPVVLVDRKPDRSQHVVQFVVDTTGVPVARTFRALRATPEVAVEARATVERWRFRPAMTGGCRVPQLVQTAIGR